MSLLVESILDGGDIKFEVAGDTDVDLDSSLSSVNPLSVPSVSVKHEKFSRLIENT